MRISGAVITLLALAILISSHQITWGQRGRQDGMRGMDFDRVAERFDKNQDGKVTREEFSGQSQMFDRMDRNGDGVITKADFEGMGQMGRGGQQARGGMPRFQEFPTARPAPGQTAPDFELRDLDGNKVSLSKLTATKPVVIEFGSFT